MFNIGFLNNTGFFNIQCQHLAKANGLDESSIQSTISTDPMIAESGHEYIIRGAELSSILALWINIFPLKLVCHDLFSTSFCPEHIKYAHGFLIVSAFMVTMYVIMACMSIGG